MAPAMRPRTRRANTPPRPAAVIMWSTVPAPIEIADAGSFGKKSAPICFNGARRSPCATSVYIMATIAITIPATIPPKWNASGPFYESARAGSAKMLSFDRRAIGSISSRAGASASPTATSTLPSLVRGSSSERRPCSGRPRRRSVWSRWTTWSSVRRRPDNFSRGHDHASPAGREDRDAVGSSALRARGNGRTDRNRARRGAPRGSAAAHGGSGRESLEDPRPRAVRHGSHDRSIARERVAITRELGTCWRGPRRATRGRDSRRGGSSGSHTRWIGPSSGHSLPNEPVRQPENAAMDDVTHQALQRHVVHVEHRHAEDRGHRGERPEDPPQDPASDADERGDHEVHDPSDDDGFASHQHRDHRHHPAHLHQQTEYDAAYDSADHARCERAAPWHDRDIACTGHDATSTPLA